MIVNWSYIPVARKRCLALIALSSLLFLRSTDITTFPSQKQFVSIKESRLLVVLLSKAFAENKDLKSFFNYATQILHKPVLLVCVGKDKSWQDSEIGMHVGQKEVYVDMTEKKKNEIADKKKLFKNLLEQKMSGLYGEVRLKLVRGSEGGKGLLL